MGFESIDQPGQSSEVERNPKMSISFFCLERGGRWDSSPLTSPTDHQKLNVIQKWAFHSLAGEGWWMGFESIDQPGWSPEIESNPKIGISFFWLETVGEMGFESIDQPGRSSEVECNPKMSISFYWLERGCRWGSSPLTSPANHQKLNINQKWALHFFGWRGVVDGVWVYRPAWLITRNWE